MKRTSPKKTNLNFVANDYMKTLVAGTKLSDTTNDTWLVKSKWHFNCHYVFLTNERTKETKLFSSLKSDILAYKLIKEANS